MSDRLSMVPMSTHEVPIEVLDMIHNNSSVTSTDTGVEGVARSIRGEG